MWVRLLTVKHIEIAGKVTKFAPEEWVNVGKHLALSWIADGSADRPDQPGLKATVGCGVVVPAESYDAATAALPGLEVTTGEPSLPFAKTLLWSPAVSFRTDLILTGFNLLDTWEVAAPLASYEVLARDIGTADDRARTEAVIRDLRVPYYEPGILFLRRCAASRDLLAAWQEERGRGDNDGLALLRAIYRVKPLILALPTVWIS